ncbi:MAG: hypothetical protein WC621_04790 [Patescibacteria group bacterium]
MPVRKAGDANIRKLTKIGQKSIGLTLPIEVIRELGWKERQKVVVKMSRKRLIIKDWNTPAFLKVLAKPRNSIQKLRSK